jgi:iduronate 2-sulfatase
MGYSIRTERFRYTEWRDFATREVKARELYDHQDDPGETRNVISRDLHADSVPRLLNLLEEVIQSTNEPRL